MMIKLCQTFWKLLVQVLKLSDRHKVDFSTKIRENVIALASAFYLLAYLKYLVAALLNNKSQYYTLDHN
jgi:hypothetical protein